jgi:hypothetical protein
MEQIMVGNDHDVRLIQLDSSIRILEIFAADTALIMCNMAIFGTILSLQILEHQGVLGGEYEILVTNRGVPVFVPEVLFTGCTIPIFIMAVGGACLSHERMVFHSMLSAIDRFIKANLVGALCIREVTAASAADPVFDVSVPRTGVRYRLYVCFRFMPESGDVIQNYESSDPIRSVVFSYFVSGRTVVITIGI